VNDALQYLLDVDGSVEYIAIVRCNMREHAVL